MKVAICFSSQPRFVNECYVGIKNNLMDQNPGDDFDTSLFTTGTRKIEQGKYYTGADFFLEKLEINIYLWKFV